MGCFSEILKYIAGGCAIFGAFSLLASLGSGNTYGLKLGGLMAVIAGLSYLGFRAAEKVAEEEYAYAAEQTRKTNEHNQNVQELENCRKNAITLLRKGGCISVSKAHELLSIKAYDTYQQEQDNRNLPYLKKVMRLVPYKTEILGNDYGKSNEQFVQFASEYVVNIDQQYSAWKEGYAKQPCDIVQELHNLCFINGEVNGASLRQALWHYAMLTPHQPHKYALAKEMHEFYSYIVHTDKNGKDFPLPSLDGLLSQAYVYSSVSPALMRTLDREIEAWLSHMTKHKDSNACIQLASGFAWIKAYEQEETVLNAILKEGLPMSEQLQNRLRFLGPRNDNLPGINLYTPENDLLSYYYASRNWSVNDFVSFFRNLTQQSKPLTYCLTISEWSDWQSYSGTWDVAELAKKLKAAMLDEFGETIKCDNARLNMLTDGGVKESAGILIRSMEKELHHSALLLLGVNIGKRLSLQVLTLFVPWGNETLQEMSMAAISLKNGDNPQIKVFLETLQDWLLASIQDILNQSVEGGLY